MLSHRSTFRKWAEDGVRVAALLFNGSTVYSFTGLLRYAVPLLQYNDMNAVKDAAISRAHWLRNLLYAHRE